MVTQLRKPSRFIWFDFHGSTENIEYKSVREYEIPKFTDAFEEFHTDIIDDYNGVSDIYASYCFYFRFLLSDGHP